MDLKAWKENMLGYILNLREDVFVKEDYLKLKKEAENFCQLFLSTDEISKKEFIELLGYVIIAISNTMLYYLDRHDDSYLDCLVDLQTFCKIEY